MSTSAYHTYFQDIDGNLLASVPGLLAISLYKGMSITLHGRTEKFTVHDWSFHQGHPDENPGLTIQLAK